MRKIFLIIILAITLAVDVFAADFYVSTTGSNAADGSIGNPWETPVYGASQLSVGDTLYIRAGTYDITTSSVSMSAAIVPAAEGCTISGYPGETAILRGDGGSGPGVAPTGGVIGDFDGSTGRANITIENLTIQGLVVLMRNNSTVRNCDISVGGDTWSGIGQGMVIWVHGGDDNIIQNNRLHDNTVQSGYSNSPTILMYNASRTIIQYNDIYNSAGTGITLKDYQDNHHVRYNHIYDNQYAGIHTGMQDPASGTQIYQNVIRNNNLAGDPEHGGIVVLAAAFLEGQIYNNTFYNNNVADLIRWTSGTTSTFYFFNNLSVAPPANHISFPYSVSVLQGSMLYCDYNQYYNDVAWKYRTSDYTTLAQWQSGCGALLTDCDANASIADPGFLNASGTYSLPSDFKRTSYPVVGRGGAWPTVIGAWLSDSSPAQIGYAAEVVAAAVSIGRPLLP